MPVGSPDRDAIAQALYDAFGVEASRTDLGVFSEYCWRDTVDFKPNGWIHKQWYDILQYRGIDGANFKRTRRLHIEAPREMAKTTCLDVKYPLWRLGKNRNLRFLIVSKTATLTTDVIREVKANIERNERLHAVFPEVLPAKPWSDTEIQVKRDLISKTPTMRGVGLHGSITGGRADVIIVDDPFDLAEVQTANQRRKVADWIENVVIPVLSPNGELAFIGTRWHYDDYWGELINKAIEKGGTYVVKVYRPTENMQDASSPLMEDSNPKALWPQVWTKKKLLERKDEIGTIRFNCLYLNDPSAMQGLIFKEDWLQYYNPEKLRFITNMRVVMGVDPAISEDPKSDWTVIVVLGLNPYLMKLYVLDVYREHLDFPDQVKKIKWKYNQWNSICKAIGWNKVAVIGIETNAYQKALASAAFMSGLPVKEINQKTNKNIRLIGLSPHFEGGRILFPDPEIERPAWLDPYVLEYLNFPRGKNDDQLDATDLAVEAADLGQTRDWAFYFG